MAQTSRKGLFVLIPAQTVLLATFVLYHYRSGANFSNGLICSHTNLAKPYIYMTLTVLLGTFVCSIIITAQAFFAWAYSFPHLLGETHLCAHIHLFSSVAQRSFRTTLAFVPFPVWRKLSLTHLFLYHRAQTFAYIHTSSFTDVA